MLVMILLVIIGILCVVLLLLNCQINKMLREADKKENEHKEERRLLEEKLYDCEAEKRELERNLAEMESRAKNAEEQRDFLKKSKTVPMGPAGWNMVFADQEKKEEPQET